MIIIPAIDIYNRRCVRLAQGKFTEQSLYDTNSLNLAIKYQKQGIKLLHLCDLNKAKNNSLINRSLVQKILLSLTIPVQYAGGIKTINDLEEMMSLGVDRVVINGLKILTNDKWEKTVAKFSSKMIAALDCIDNKLLKNAWQKKTVIDLFDAADNLKKIGIRKFIYTDVNRDGILQEPSYKNIEAIRQKINLPLIVAGGISSIKQIDKLKNIGIDEVVVGKAIFEKKITIKEVVGYAN